MPNGQLDDPQDVVCTGCDELAEVCYDCSAEGWCSAHNPDRLKSNNLETTFSTDVAWVTEKKPKKRKSKAKKKKPASEQATAS